MKKPLREYSNVWHDAHTITKRKNKMISFITGLLTLGISLVSIKIMYFAVLGFTILAGISLAVYIAEVITKIRLGEDK